MNRYSDAFEDLLVESASINVPQDRVDHSTRINMALSLWVQRQSKPECTAANDNFLLMLGRRSEE